MTKADLQRLRKLLAENTLDPDRLMPEGFLYEHFSHLPFESQKIMIERSNPRKHYRPLDIRKYPRLKQSGVVLDPHRQLVCPTCYMILQRDAVNRYFGGRCPKCGTLLRL